MKTFIYGYDGKNPAACAEMLKEKGIGAVVAGSFDEAAATAFRAAGMDMYLCFGAHGIGGKKEGEYRLARDYANREKKWFSSACPNDISLARERMENALSAAEKIPDLRGVFVDGARFSSFASAEGMDAFFTCFCPACMEKMQEMGMDGEKIRAAVRRLSEDEILDLADIPLLRAWLSFRETCVKQYMDAFSAAVHEKNPRWQAGAFVFAPSLGVFVGQTENACAHLDIISPMLYRAYPHEQGPACMNHEWGACYALLRKKADAFRKLGPGLHEEMLAGERKNILHGGFLPSAVGDEIAFASQRIRPGQILAPIIQIEDERLAETARICLENGADQTGYFCFSQGKWKNTKK